MTKPRVAVMHYSAPPVVGGVESVMEAHLQAFVRHGYPVTVIAGRGDQATLPPGASFILIPEIDSQHPGIAKMSSPLEQGQLPSEFGRTTDKLAEILSPILEQFDHLIVHNILTKHFSLPLTAALHKLLDAKIVNHCIAWCHDFTWASPASRSKVHPGYPWDLLRTYRPEVTYVAVSRRGQNVLADLLQCSIDDIHVVYNGVEPESLLGLSQPGYELISRLGLLRSDLTLLMPVRVTEAKNIEYAMQVVRALKTLGCTSRLIVTGPPDPHSERGMAYFGELQALRRQLNVAEEVSFVFEAGLDGAPLAIAPGVVGDLYRVSDIMFMPSHREGFGMPILEAGLIGMPVVCTDVPAAEEIGGDNVTVFAASEDPLRVAEKILQWSEQSPIHRLRRRVRQNYTWDTLFDQAIEPLLADRGDIRRE